MYNNPIEPHVEELWEDFALGDLLEDIKEIQHEKVKFKILCCKKVTYGIFFRITESTRCKSLINC